MGLLETYDYVFTETGDERTNHWLFLGSPVPLLLLTLAYLYFVLSCGPRYMRDKKPYSFKTYTKCYNLFQVFVNSLIVHQIIDAGFFTNIGFTCSPLTYSYEPGEYKMAQILWWILCLKIFDYTETFVFVLRKKNRQISFLHLYHHVSTVWLIWIQVKYYAGGMLMLIEVMNCSVHVIMYSYYFLSTYGHAVRRYTDPFKPYITAIQMVQFVILMVHCVQLFLPACPRIGFISYVWLANLLINFTLFFNFYRTNYVQKKKK